MQLYRKTNDDCARIVTLNYSTSFSMGIQSFSKDLRTPIYSIYGFVRYADEIVDTFYSFNQAELIKEFREDTYKAIKRGISLNPILDCFQNVVNKYNIDYDLIDSFLDSMEMDLNQIKYNNNLYSKYIYGSAEVVGLMCLKVFTNGNEATYHELSVSARHLGSAFQKINFLRDMQDDYVARSRSYFPGLDLSRTFTEQDKSSIIQDISNDLDLAYPGILILPDSSRQGVLLAFWFYHNLLQKLKRTSAEKILQSRVRISNFQKLTLASVAIIKNRLNSII
jgi:phytoene/squalene synthetase